MSPPIAVTILSGFLGSGKTTLLNQLLRADHGRKIAVIVNEFGAVGIDGSLVPNEERFVEMDNGCLCCALNEDLVETLEAICAKGGIDHVVIETTGLADPLPVAWSCTRPSVSQRLRVDAIVTVVDCASIARALNESREARQQVQRGDILVLNKLDLVQDGGAAARQLIQETNGQAPVVECIQGKIPWPLLLGDGASKRRSGEKEPHPPHDPGSKPHSPASHGQGALHYETLSFALPADRPLDEAALEALTYRIPEEVFRFKALLRVDSPEGPWLLINGVAGRIDLRFLTPEKRPELSAWVFIGRNLDGPSLRRLCAEAVEVAPESIIDVR